MTTPSSEAKAIFASRPLLLAAGCCRRLFGGNRRRNKVSRIDRSEYVRLDERVLSWARRHRLNALAQHWRRCDRRINNFLGRRGVGVDRGLNDALGPLAWNFLAHRLLEIFGISTDWMTGGQRRDYDPVRQIRPGPHRSGHKRACLARIVTDNERIERAQKLLRRRRLDTAGPCGADRARQI